MSVHAVVLIGARSTASPRPPRRSRRSTACSEVYSVAGEFDLVAIVRVAQHEDLARVDPARASRRVDGVAQTESLIAFQVYSSHDLERMFSLGFDQD